MFRLYIVGLFLFFNKIIVFSLEDGDSCTLKLSGSQGRCTLLSKCKPALDNLQQHQIFPQTCSFQAATPIVCCPQSSSALLNHTSLSEAPPSTTIPSPPSRPSGARVEGEISRRKCIEYDKYAYVRRRPPILLLNAEEVEHLDCAFKTTTNWFLSNKPRQKEYPHMAIIGYERTSNRIFGQCSGSIISPQFILTAAHCLLSRDFGPAKYVLVGITDLNSSENMQNLTIYEQIKHPDYHPSSYYHDIALLKLERNITLNLFSRPACLYTNRIIHTSKAIASGWGRAYYSGDSATDLMQEVLDLIPIDICKTSYNDQTSAKLKMGIKDDVQICVGREDKDTCANDLGGPLQIFHDWDDVKCMYDIVGVSSFGKACGVRNSPGIYTRVSNYIKWIEDIVWP